VRLSYRIPLITGIILILTAVVNIWAFQILSEKYFTQYLTELTTDEDSSDPDRIQALLQIGKLNTLDQAEYLAILSELSNLSTAIENISKNPELYMMAQSASGDTMFNLPIASDYRRSFLPFFDLTVLWENSIEWRFVGNVLQGITIVNIIWLFVILLGYFFWVSSIFYPIQTVMSTIQNIIDRKRYASIRYSGRNEFTPLISTINNLHKSLSIQEKIRSDFLSDLSHEIRTPITAVKCYLEAIQDWAMKLDTKTVDLLHSELTRLTDITGRIMDYESLTHDVFDQVKVERFSLKKLTEQIIGEYYPQLQKSNQNIQVYMPTDTMTSMDKGMYIQILHNIISNFIKYAGTDTTLDVYYEKYEKEYSIIFSDDGIGIPEKELAFVKEKFYRVDKARTQSDKSMGIGLSLVDRIARLHRWSLTVEKNTPKGVRFIVKVGR
jgi:signal transduction histidine kinase